MLNLKDFKYVTINFGEIDPKKWMDNTGCQYPLIVPNGTKVEFVGVYINYYGRWFEVEHEGRLQYILPCFCEGNVMIKKESYEYFDVASLTNKVVIYYMDKYGKRYRLLNSEGDLELVL